MSENLRLIGDGVFTPAQGAAAMLRDLRDLSASRGGAA